MSRNGTGLKSRPFSKETTNEVSNCCLTSGEQSLLISRSYRALDSGL